MSKQAEILTPTHVTSVIKTASKVTLRVETGKVTFTPVAYNSFDVGSVAIELELPSGTDVAAALVEMDEVCAVAFRSAYARRLDSYTKALRYNDKQVEAAREAERR